MRVAVIGSRESGPEDDVCQKIKEHLPQNCSEIVSGGAKGVDLAAKRTADELRLRFTCFLPRYELYGIAALQKRNEKIIDYADFVLAFWNLKSHGTRNALALAIKTGKPIKIVEI